MAKSNLILIDQPNKVKYANNSLQKAAFLQDRLDSLNKIVERRSSLVRFGVETFPEDIGNNKYSKDSCDPAIFIEDNESDSGSIHLLLTKDPDIPHTDAAKRLETMFDTYHEEGSIGHDKKKKKRESKRKYGLSRLEAKRRERRRREIQRFQALLEENSSKYLARAANSIRFKVTSRDSISMTGNLPSMNPEKYPPSDSYPIPLGGSEMNPDLFLGYSCEKMAIKKGKKIMKEVSLHPISLNLFVVMYWFIHCRFFQKSSGSEQRYLLGNVASIFPHLLKVIVTLAPDQDRDNIHRTYPFVLSQGIYLAFKFLCPGNHALFKGAFQRILYLSVFRMLTGVDICPGSVEALRYSIFPEESIDDDNRNPDQERDNRLRPIPGDFGGRSWNHDSTIEHEIKKDCKFGLGNVSSTRNSVIKFMGDRTSLRFRADKPVSLGQKILSRQQQVNFDANQISPLLQQCLGREVVTRRPKQYMKRTEPVRYCRTGGVDTYHSIREEIESHEARRRSMMDEHKASMRKIRTESLTAKKEYRRQLRQFGNS